MKSKVDIYRKLLAGNTIQSKIDNIKIKIIDDKFCTLKNNNWIEYSFIVGNASLWEMCD